MTLSLSVSPLHSPPPPSFSCFVSTTRRHSSHAQAAARGCFAVMMQRRLRRGRAAETPVCLYILTGRCERSYSHEICIWIKRHSFDLIFAWKLLCVSLNVNMIFFFVRLIIFSLMLLHFCYDSNQACQKKPTFDVFLLKCKNYNRKKNLLFSKEIKTVQ